MAIGGGLRYRFHSTAPRTDWPRLRDTSLIRIAGRALACERSAAWQTDGAEAYGKSVWFWHPWLVSNRRRFSQAQPGSQNRQFADDGGKRNSSPGRARHKPSNHCAGKAGCSPLDLYARVRTSSCTLHTRPRVQRAPGLPCALSLRASDGGTTRAPSRRENATPYPPLRP